MERRSRTCSFRRFRTADYRPPPRTRTQSERSIWRETCRRFRDRHRARAVAQLGIEDDARAPRHRVETEGFRECVTNEQYERCIDASVCYGNPDLTKKLNPVVNEQTNAMVCYPFAMDSTVSGISLPP